MFKLVRFLFGAVAAVYLIAVFGFGAGMTYLSHDPEAAAAVAVGAASLSADRGFSENVSSFKSGAAAGTDMVRAARQLEEERKLRRRLRASRSTYGDDWGDESLTSDWGN